MIRDPEQVHNHRMLSEELLQDAVTLTATAVISAGQLIVDVDLTNDKTGHHMPTDSPLRHAILVVEAQDADGQTVAVAGGADAAGVDGQLCRGARPGLRRKSSRMSGRGRNRPAPSGGR